MMMWLMLASMAHAAPESAPTCPERTVWPGADWPSSLRDAPELDAYLFSPDLDRSDKERRGVRTDGVVIVHGGQIVYERYGGGYDAKGRHLAWSATKSFTNALVGIAVGEGLVLSTRPRGTWPDSTISSSTMAVGRANVFCPGGGSWRRVVVRTADDRDGSYEHDKTLALVGR